MGNGALILNVTGNDNTAIGADAGQNLADGSNNILIGLNAGQNLTDGSNNIVIGLNADFASTITSNQLNIGNLIYGTGLDGGALSTGNIGIGVQVPTSKLQVVGLPAYATVAAAQADAGITAGAFYVLDAATNSQAEQSIVRIKR
jgi:hypothetical protein